MRDYQAVWMENDFLRVMLLPKLGGRIHRSILGESNSVISSGHDRGWLKPALVGLLETWMLPAESNLTGRNITGRRPLSRSIFLFQQGESGAQTVWMGEAEPMRGLQVMAEFTLYPDRALIEMTGKIFPMVTPHILATFSCGGASPAR
ncbi:DUF5107 domain-containing protein [Klebsiella pneumoniae]|nr:DUF5107 domain-containing protein [Klebsiella pneumoniae]